MINSNYINPYSLVQDIKSNSSLLNEDSIISITIEGSHWAIECNSIRQGIIIKPSLFKTLDIKVPLVQVSKDVNKILYKYISSLNQYTESNINVIELNKSNLIFLSFYTGISNDNDYNRFLKEDIPIIEALKNNIVSRIVDAVTLISNIQGSPTNKKWSDSSFSESEIQNPIKNLANKQEEVTSDLERRLLDLLNQDKDDNKNSSVKGNTSNNSPQVFEDEDFYEEVEEEQSDNSDYWDYNKESLNKDSEEKDTDNKENNNNKNNTDNNDSDLNDNN